MALRYAVKQQVRLTGTEGFREYVPDNNLAGSCQYAFATDDKGTDLDRYMLRFAQGPKGIVLPGIFFSSLPRATVHGLCGTSMRVFR